MKAMSKAVSLLAISVALTLSGSHVFAKNEGLGRGKVIRHFCRTRLRFWAPAATSPKNMLVIMAALAPNA